MVIRDLKEPCSPCGGSGRLAGVSKLGITQINATGVCPRCKGRGFRLTNLGQDLLKLLRPFVEEWIDERSGGGSPPVRQVPPIPT